MLTCMFQSFLGLRRWLALENLLTSNPARADEVKRPAVCAKEVAATGEVFATGFSTRHTAPVWLNIYISVTFNLIKD